MNTKEFMMLRYDCLKIAVLVPKEIAEEKLKSRKKVREELTPFWREQRTDLENKNRPLKEEIL